MKDNPAWLFRLLAAALAAMLIGVTGLIAFVHVASLRLDEADRQIAENSSPSVLAIESASAALSRLQILLHDRVRGLDAPDAPLEAERQALAANVDRYLALPIDPGETQVHAELQRALARMDQLVDRVRAMPPETSLRARDALRTELDAVASLLDTTLLSAANLNAEIGTEAVGKLHQIQHELLPGAVAFEIASAVAAAVAIAAAYRVNRRAQEAARTSQRLLEQKAAELDAFSGRVAHDLLSPLMTVSMAVGLAEQRLSAPAEARLHDVLGRAGKSLVRVRQLVSDLLAFARAGATPAPGASVAVAPLLDELVTELQPVASDAGVELQLASSSRRCVRCAAGILASMLENLVQNAIRYAGGEASARSVVVRAIDGDAEVRFEVEDSGPGIGPEDQEAIFEPYVRRNSKGAGLGLGLATVKRLAESHGGHVGVRSALGEGALFWITLPATACP
jgi:signal transduction histidine kinase